MWDNSPAFGGFDDEMWCNGNTTDFDSVIAGSNPAVSGGKIKYSFMILLSLVLMTARKDEKWRRGEI